MAEDIGFSGADYSIPARYFLDKISATRVCRTMMRNEKDIAF